ncbi:MAG: hypothetical protein ACRDNF_23495 [Streptosporangiaceae bacterium]
MSLTTIRSDEERCDNGRTCPHVSATDRQTLVVQGYVTPELAASPGIPAGEIAVEVPLELLPELAAESSAGLHVTDHGTVVFHGPAVSDPGTLAELTIPPGEAAIEIPAGVLPFLEVAGRA